MGHREVLVCSVQGASLLMLFLRALLLPTVQGRKLFPSYRRKEQKTNTQKIDKSTKHKH